MELHSDCIPLIHIKYSFLDVVHSRLSTRKYEQLVDNLCNILPMLARSMQSAAKKFRNHSFESFLFLAESFLPQSAWVALSLLQDIVAIQIANHVFFQVKPSRRGRAAK